MHHRLAHDRIEMRKDHVPRRIHPPQRITPHMHIRTDLQRRLINHAQVGQLSLNVFRDTPPITRNIPPHRLPQVPLAVVEEPGLVVEILPRAAQLDKGRDPVLVRVLLGPEIAEDPPLQAPGDGLGGVGGEARGVEVIGVQVGGLFVLDLGRSKENQLAIYDI